ncbi:hypothetical protein [Duganella guangzhouensis]|nr:hypothetical protein [Duganella guangzhouensis]
MTTPADSNDDQLAVIHESLTLLHRRVGAIEHENMDRQSEAFKAEMAAFKAQIELSIKIQLDAAFKAHTEEMHRTFATKQELANAVYLLTWRMAGFCALLLSAGFAFARYL